MLKLLRIHSSFTTTVDAQLHFWGLNRDIAVRTWLGRQYTNFARYSFTHFFFFSSFFIKYIYGVLSRHGKSHNNEHILIHTCVFFFYLLLIVIHRVEYLFPVYEWHVANRVAPSVSLSDIYMHIYRIYIASYIILYRVYIYIYRLFI